MPMYEYECSSCGRILEVIQSVNARAPRSCECGEKGTLKKRLSAPAFQFKGSGWYITDYARKGSGGTSAGKEAEGGAEASTASADTAQEPKGESKADAKKDAKKDSKKDAAQGASKSGKSES